MVLTFSESRWRVLNSSLLPCLGLCHTKKKCTKRGFRDYCTSKQAASKAPLPSAAEASGWRPLVAAPGRQARGAASLLKKEEPPPPPCHFCHFDCSLNKLTFWAAFGLWRSARLAASAAFATSLALPLTCHLFWQACAGCVASCSVARQ